MASNETLFRFVDNVTLDINNISVLAGFSSVVILLWLFFSLSTELRNITLAFDYAAGSDVGELDLCVSLLMMRQVFTIGGRAPSGAWLPPEVYPPVAAR